MGKWPLICQQGLPNSQRDVVLTTWFSAYRQGEPKADIPEEVVLVIAMQKLTLHDAKQCAISRSFSSLVGNQWKIIKFLLTVNHYLQRSDLKKKILSNLKSLHSWKCVIDYAGYFNTVSIVRTLFRFWGLLMSNHIYFFLEA